MIDKTPEELRSYLVSLLKDNVVEVTFTKVNGDQRVMPCTLNETVIPISGKSSVNTKKKNDEVMSVWCLDKKEWRSFRLANVTNIQVLAK